MHVEIKNGRIVKIEKDGQPVLKELWGVHYEHAIHTGTAELKKAIEDYENEHPIEKASRLLRKYKEGVEKDVPEGCSCTHR